MPLGLGRPKSRRSMQQAAAWLDGAEGKMQQHKRSQAQNSYNRHSGPKGKGAPTSGGVEAPARPRGQSHAELIAQARKANEPVSIDGKTQERLPMPLSQMMSLGYISQQKLHSHDSHKLCAVCMSFSHRYMSTTQANGQITSNNDLICQAGFHPRLEAQLKPTVQKLGGRAIVALQQPSKRQPQQ